MRAFWLALVCHRPGVVLVGFTGTTVKLRQRGSIDLFASPDVAYKNVSGT